MSAPSDWDAFVVRHTKPLNLAIHGVSFAAFFGGPPLALALWSPYPLVAFAVSGLLGSFGHWISDDGRVSVKEATHQKEVPPWVAVMFWMILRGRWGAEVDAARGRIAAHQGAEKRTPFAK